MDGGSPLSCKNEAGFHELSGLVTFGTSCEGSKEPTMFTNIGHYVDWIRKNAKHEPASKFQN